MRAHPLRHLLFPALSPGDDDDLDDEDLEEDDEDVDDEDEDDEDEEVWQVRLT